MSKPQREAAVEGVGKPGSLAKREVLPGPEDYRQPFENVHVARPFNPRILQARERNGTLCVALNDGGDAEASITRAYRCGSGAEEREAQSRPECGAAFLMQEGDELRWWVGTCFGSPQPGLLRLGTHGLDTTP